MSLPTFYVSDRRPAGHRTRLTCYDRVMFTGESPDISDVNFDSDGYVMLSVLLGIISNACGFEHIAVSSFISENIPRVHKQHIDAKSCREILSHLAKSACGYFVLSNDVLMFIPFGSEGITASFEINEYNSVFPGMTKRCTAIEVINGSEIYATGSADAYDTMTVETEYASPEYAGALISELREKQYTAWSCDKSRVYEYPAPASALTFSGASFVTNYCRMKITPSGCYASVGRNNVVESEYITRTRRELSERVKIGETNGNTKIDRDGVKLIFKNENSSEEYGFQTAAGGITKFAGAMMDSILPDMIVKDSELSRIMHYGSKKIKLSWELDDSGNKVNITQEEIT